MPIPPSTSANLRQHAIVESGPRAGCLVLRHRQRRPRRQGALEPEPGIDCLQRPQGTEQKAARHEQDDRRRDFGDYQSAADSLPATAAAARSLAQSLARAIAMVLDAASARPSRPPVAVTTKLSVSSCRSTRSRPAPSAMRTAISRRLTIARASRRLVRFAHA